MVVTGTVADGREALISLVLLGPDERRAAAVAVIDTGFTGHLVLPPALVNELDLPLRGSRDSYLADGSRISLDAHRVGVEWDGLVRVVPALTADGGPLVDMSFLRGSEIRIQATDDDEVEIRPLL